MSAAVQNCFREIDMLVQGVSLALGGASGDELVKVCNDLQQQVFRLQHLMQQSPASTPAQPQQVLRARKAAAALASLQESLARRTVLTQQSLQTLFPMARSDTYSAGLGGIGGVRADKRQPYGSAGRCSGEFRVIAA